LSASKPRLASLSRSGSSPALGASPGGLLKPYAGDDFLTRGGAGAPARGAARTLRRTNSRSDVFDSETNLGGSLGRNSEVSTADTPTSQQDDTGDDGALKDVESSSLLRRRMKTPLAVETAKAGNPEQGTPSDYKEITELEENQKIYDLYQWDEVLQETGDGGKVVVCQPKNEPRSPGSPSHLSKYVMKIRSKESLDQDCMGDQFRKSLLRMLNLPSHAGVLPIHEVLEDDKFYYVVMEKASGGSFFHTLLGEFADGVMPGSAVRRLTREILEALGHVHAQGILHRDIKPDNLVFMRSEDPASPTRKKVKRVSIIDFDHADPEFEPGSASTQTPWCGTVRFSAPETFQGTFSQGSDLYSVGVILYMLIAGKMPYEDSLFEAALDRRGSSPTGRRFNWRANVYQRMKEALIDWESEPWTNDPACREFCQGLLAWDPGSRPSSAEEALKHPWFAT